MTAPRISPLHQIRLNPCLPLPPFSETCLRSSAEVYVALTSGSFRGHRIQQGDLLVCDASPGCGDLVVLTARGPGRPRLGSLSPVGMLGDAGEPCSEARWELRGRLVAVLRHERNLWREVPALPGGQVPTFPKGLGGAWRAVMVFETAQSMDVSPAKQSTGRRWQAPLGSQSAPSESQPSRPLRPYRTPQDAPPPLQQLSLFDGGLAIAA